MGQSLEGQAPADAAPVQTRSPLSPATDSGSQFGLKENGDFVANIAGQAWTLTAAQLAQAQIRMSSLRQPLPGLRFETIAYNQRDTSLTITADVSVPGLESSAITVKINHRGETRFSGNASRRFSLPAIGNANLTLAYDSTQGVTGTATLEGASFVPRVIPGLKAEGGGQVNLAEGRLAGAGTVTLTYQDLGVGTIDFRFEKGQFSAGGTLKLTPPFLKAIEAQVSVDSAANVTASATLDLAGLQTSVPHLQLSGGSVTIGLLNATPSLAISDLQANYAGLGTISVASLTLNSKSQPEGDGAFTATIPMLSEASGAIKVRRGKVSGQLSLGKENFPAGLPIKAGTITARLGESGELSLEGRMKADFGPAGQADLTAAFGDQGFAIAGEADLTIAGLSAIHLSATYSNGDLAGEVKVPVNAALLPGVSGDVTVRFSQGRWGGESTLQFSADDGKLTGTVAITISQAEDNTISIGGSGALTAQLVPGIAGTLRATILPEGAVDVSGEIIVSEPYEMFPEINTDKELFKYSQSIPLWAILVAVIKVRAGIRAGIGPGVFRDIKVTGSYTVGSKASEPSFSLSGEMYVPAYAEAYVAFGAGLGLDVVLGSLTGGIEGVGTAGVYGAISVIPELSYMNGDWCIDGTATLAAGARLKLGLNAWAEVEALMITVWEQTWKLTEFVMPIGPDLGLQAKMHYVFGQGTAPELELNSSDIDTTKLIQDAMPKDGPAGSGAREALQNKAEWKGKLKEAKIPPVPAALAAHSGQTTRPPEPPPRPPKNPPPAVVSGPAAANKSPGNPLPPTAPPRFPKGISLSMLEEPPVASERTPEEQLEDLAAAKRLLELASAEATSSDALDDYFPRIRNRLRMTSLGYAGDFETGFSVVGKINPELKVFVEEPLVGTGLTLGLGRQTDIVHSSSGLGGDVVGVKMTAKQLGPEHPQGSGPSGQTKLMSLLPTDPMKFADANSRFVRGHLLNDWLGGQGVPANLFPITAHANTLHNTEIEEAVKDWVNNKKHWVRYTVQITVKGVDLGEERDDNYVNSVLTAEASVLSTKLQPVPSLTRKIVVESTFLQPASVSVKKALTPQAEQGLGQRQDLARDEAVVPLATSRKSEGPGSLFFPDALMQALRDGLLRLGNAENLRNRLLAEKGWGPASVAVLWKAYEYVKNEPNLASKPLDNLSSDEQTLFRSLYTRWSRNPGSLLGPNGPS